MTAAVPSPSVPVPSVTVPEVPIVTIAGGLADADAEDW